MYPSGAAVRDATEHVLTHVLDHSHSHSYILSDTKNLCAYKITLSYLTIYYALCLSGISTESPLFFSQPTCIKITFPIFTIHQIQLNSCTHPQSIWIIITYTTLINTHNCPYMHNCFIHCFSLYTYIHFQNDEISILIYIHVTIAKHNNKRYTRSSLCSVLTRCNPRRSCFSLTWTYASRKETR